MIKKEEIKGFFADAGKLDLEKYVIETYWFETTGEPEHAAASLCSEQSTAQWRRPGVDEDLRNLHGAKIIDLKILEVSDRPSFAAPFNRGKSFTRCIVKISHPHINFGPKIPNLLTAVAGEGVFHTPTITSIKLLDLGFPTSFLSSFQGPQFGVDGIRKLLDVNGRPLFIGVVKPNIGLSPKDFAEIAFQGWKGGLDIAKDDEMQADAENSPFEKRMKMTNRKRLEAERLTGEKKIFLANITDEVDRLIELHDIAVANGAGAVMVNSITVGLSAIRMLRKHAAVPIVGHFPLIASFSRIPFFGISSTVVTKLQRITGCDIIIMPGFGERMMVEEHEVISNIETCASKLSDMKRVLPVPGGSDWAGTLPLVYNKLRTIDFGFIMGRGVFGHPRGASSGAKSVRQAWEAIVGHVPIDEYAKTNQELAIAIKEFGGRKDGDVIAKSETTKQSSVSHEIATPLRGSQ